MRIPWPITKRRRLKCWVTRGTELTRLSSIRLCCWTRICSSCHQHTPLERNKYRFKPTLPRLINQFTNNWVWFSAEGAYALGTVWYLELTKTPAWAEVLWQKWCRCQTETDKLFSEILKSLLSHTTIKLKFLLFKSPGVFVLLWIFNCKYVHSAVVTSHTH